LKEQATKWEVTVAQLNADLACKLQFFFRHNLYTDTYTPFANIISISQTCFPLPSKTLRGLCSWIERAGVSRLTRPTRTCRNSCWPCNPGRTP
jgi:hypothetical protein